MPGEYLVPIRISEETDSGIGLKKQLKIFITN